MSGSSMLCRVNRIAGAVIVITPMLIGCGGQSGLQKLKVEGMVTLNDTPIQNGEIRFFPIDGTAGSVSGAPIRDGRYLAEGRGGVPVGKHRVEIMAYRASRNPGPVSLEGGPAEQFLPPRFNSQSELVAEVSSETKMLNFDLKD